MCAGGIVDGFECGVGQVGVEAVIIAEQGQPAIRLSLGQVPNGTGMRLLDVASKLGGDLGNGRLASVQILRLGNSLARRVRRGLSLEAEPL